MRTSSLLRPVGRRATTTLRNFKSGTPPGIDLLDALERGEQFNIVRRGKVVAHIEPVGRGRGAAVKTALRRHAADAGWRGDLAGTRQLLSVEERT